MFVARNGSSYFAVQSTENGLRYFWSNDVDDVTVYPDEDMLRKDLKRAGAINYEIEPIRFE